MGVELPLEIVWQIVVSVALLLLGGRTKLEQWFGSGQSDHDELIRLQERQKALARRLDRLQDGFESLEEKHYETGGAMWFPRSSRLPDAEERDAP